MQSFEDYARSFRVACNTGLLDLCIQNNEYCVFEGKIPLLTPGKKSFSHPSDCLLRLVIADLQLNEPGRDDNFPSSLLFGFMKDVLQKNEDLFFAQWKEPVASDPFVRLKVVGESSPGPLDPDEPLFTFSFLSLAGLLKTVNRFSGRMMAEVSMSESETHPFHLILEQAYRGLSFEQKSAVQGLSSRHWSGIVLPLLFVTGEITPVEYAHGLVALRMKAKEQLPEVLAGMAEIQSWLDCGQPRRRAEKQIAGIIKAGEGDMIEFKSTLRWDIRAGKTNPAIEHSCLKTISAFLNSSGGILLIGVRDDGSIEGIETDRLPNEDKFLLHLWTLIRNCLGKDFSPYIQTRLEKTCEKTVCIVSCQPSSRPAFLRQSGFDEEMYIRVGPSSNALSISEALKYIEDHFQTLPSPQIYQE